VKELGVSDLTFLGPDKLFVIVLLAVHLEHDEDVFSCHQKAFSVVLRHSLLCIVVNHDLFEVGLIVLPIAVTLMRIVILWVAELFGVNLSWMLPKKILYLLVVSLVNKMEGVLVSKLDEAQLSEDGRVNDSEVVFDCLVEDHMVNFFVDSFSHRPDQVDSMHIYVF
jgi:hypothetical protein